MPVDLVDAGGLPAIMSGTGGGAQPQLSGADVLDIIDAGVDELLALALDELDGQERIELAGRIASVRTRLESVRGSLLIAMQQKRDHEIMGARDVFEIEVATSREPAPEVRRVIARAESLRDLPLFDEALKRASISPRHVDALRQAIREPQLMAKLSDVDYGEAYLLELAERYPADRFKRKLKSWAIRFAPKKADEEHQQALREETLTIVESDGGWAVRGWLSKLSGSALDTVLKALMFSTTPQLGFERKNAVGTAGIAGADGSPRSSLHGEGEVTSDSRTSGHLGASEEAPRITPPQLRAQALAALAKYILDHGLLNPESRVRPHISVHVPLHTLEGFERAAIESKKCEELAEAFGHFGDPIGDGCTETERCGTCLGRDVELRSKIGQSLSTIRAGYAEDLLTGLEPPETDEGIPLSPSEFATLMCGSDLRRIVLSSDSEVLDVGRKYRVATAAQTRAVIARDRTCRYPGCHRPPSDGQVHHGFEWENGGLTDLNNLVLLCWHHHQYLHANNIDVHHHSGGFLFKKGPELVGVTLNDQFESMKAA